MNRCFELIFTSVLFFLSPVSVCVCVVWCGVSRDEFIVGRNCHQ